MQNARRLVQRAAEDWQAPAPALGHQPRRIGGGGVFSNGDDVDPRHHGIAQPQIRQFERGLQPIANVAWHGAGADGGLQHRQKRCPVAWRTGGGQRPVQACHAVRHREP